MDNKIIDQYTLELEMLSEDEGKPSPVRCIATNTDDKSTAEAWMTREMSHALLGFFTGTDADYWAQQLAENRYVDLISSHTNTGVPLRYIINAPDLPRFGFSREELRPWRLEEAS
jgi:hypothetical protein